MTDGRDDHPFGQESSAPSPPLPWDDFGVPHGGPPDPRTSPYRSALDERPGAPTAPSGPPPGYPAHQTQPIETSPWGTPSGSMGPSASMGSPGGVMPPAPYPGLPGQEGFGPPSGGYPSAPTTPVPTTPRKPRRALGTVAIALVSALIGGGAVVAGNHYLTQGVSLGSALPAPGPGSTARPDGSIAKIAANALPSVVTIKIKASGGTGTGSGFVIDKLGHILTNNHVVAAAGGSGTITVELNNGTDLPAEVVGKDASYDLAVIKVNTTDLVPLEFGRSADVVVGDGVIAVGAPLGLDATVTSGIVSALNRPVTPGDGGDTSYINAIQTDAAINPGNSGGPLLDMNGRVIGVNSAIARVPGSSADTGGNIGVGFSIPSDQAAKTAQQLITTGKAEHPVLGVNVDQSFDGSGAKIAQGGVPSGSPAATAGLQSDDVVVEFEGRKVSDANSLIVAVRAKNVGDTVKLKVLRGDQTLDVTMTLQGATG
ncbi:MAG: trypsin-like peptidase domain-containing protein [Lapillicoccus sp.]